MRKGKSIVYLLTLLLACVIYIVGIKEAGDILPLSAKIRVQGQEETVSCWQTPSGKVYVFLPSYAEMDQVFLHVPGDGIIQIGQTVVTDNMSCEEFEINTRYPLKSTGIVRYDANRITFLKSEHVGTLFLDVRSGDMAYLNEDKKHDEPGSIRLYDAQGNLNYAGQAQAVSGRGQSSWKKEKKSYNVTLKQDADLLNLGSAKKWILQASSLDETGLRNKIVYDFADAVGLAYSPGCQWIDLYLNGEYAGLYLLCERNEVHPQRVAIAPEGSFLVTKDWEWRFMEDNDPFVMTEAKTALKISYSDMPAEELQRIWQSVENAILAEDGTDPVTGKKWDQLIDAQSWARKYLIEEVFGNEDGMTLSQFFYLDGSREDGRICAGPVWDYDLAMHGPYNAFYANKENVYGSSWYPALYRNEEFYEILKNEYALRFKPLLEKLLNQDFEAYALQTAQAAAMNAVRWELYEVPLQVQRIQDFLIQRVEFLDSVWLEGKQYITVSVKGYEGYSVEYHVEAGAPLPELPVYESDDTVEFLGWYYEGTDIPADIRVPVTEDTAIILKYEQPRA